MQAKKHDEIKTTKIQKKRKWRRFIRNVKRNKKILCACACVIVLAVVIAKIVQTGKESQTPLLDTILLEDRTTFSVEQQGDSQVETAGEVINPKSQALPEYYEKKYMAGSPAHYSEEEIEIRLKTLVDLYPEFQTIYDNQSQYPEALLNNLCCNPNMIDFALGYAQNYNQTSGTLEESELTGIPLFIQWDKRWGYDAYGDDVVGLSGCGPTCLSMVIVGLTKNKDATPDKLADYASENGYYEAGSGTKWTFMDEAGTAYGVQEFWIPLQKDRIVEELQAGHPIICAMRSGDFTAQGHFVVMVGVDGDQIRIHDPNSIERSRQLWDYDTLQYQIAGLWAYKLVE